MPTGYTAAIADGISFQKYALQCARAFGALILMRDEPLDAPIPPKFEPSDHYANRGAELRARLIELDAMSHERADRAATDDYNKQCADRAARIAEKDALRAKYKAMLSQVQAWTPPSPDHQGLKDFMVKQIEESIDWDCRVYPEEAPRQRTGAEWLSEQVTEVRRQIAYYEAEDAKERERANGRTEWVRQLRESLQ